MTRPGIESSEISNRETLRIFGRALRYVAPFKRNFGWKILLTLASLSPFLVLPWPVKILIDNVIRGVPISGDQYPFYFFPEWVVSTLAQATPLTVLLWTLSAQFVLVLAVGAMGTSGRERDQTDAALGGGHDSATRTENQANSGWSLAGGLLGLYDFAFTLRLSQDINHHYRSRLFERIQELPMTAFDDEKIGDAVYRVMYDTPAITSAVYRLLITPIAVPISMVAIAFVLPREAADQYGLLFWTALALIPGTLLVTLPFAGWIRGESGESRRSGATATASVEEGISNILAVQSLGGEERERKRFDRDSWTAFRRYRALVLAGMVTFVAALTIAIPLLGYVFLHLVGLVIDGGLSPGDFTAVLAYFFTLASFATQLGSVWIISQDAAAGLRRVFFLMDLPAERDPPAARPLPRLRETLRVEDVSFSYLPGTPALQNLSFETSVGKITAVVGPAGAGKTTLLYMIPRFLSPDSGRVTIDGIDIAGVTRESLRKQVAFLFQENVLFDGSIEENIRMGNLNASMLELRRAAEIAGADEFVQLLPQKYQTQLGSAGAKLSVGQKQRISIARALVRDSRILILDEPTSALDPDTEHRLVAAIREASRSRIVLVIAHRLSTIRGADEILFLQDGRILERGTHAELIAQPDGRYRRYVSLQTRGAA
ncbi:MAG: ABC transporter ATP-binding protein [Myxococcales bacterium]|nr:ABC transporter ATP-binding protein [Myxococcales bacterium]